MDFSAADDIPGCCDMVHCYKSRISMLRMLSFFHQVQSFLENVAIMVTIVVAPLT